MKMQKKPYEEGYYDGYADCKKFYERLLQQYAEKFRNLEDELYRTCHMIPKQHQYNKEQEKLIELGRAVKTIMREGGK